MQAIKCWSHSATAAPRCHLRIVLVLATLSTVFGAWAVNSAEAAQAPGAPGLPSTWGPAAKDFLGTSLGSASKVYFTGAQGIVTEVFYPTPDTVQNVDLQFVVMDAQKTYEAVNAEERRQTRHDITLVNKRALVWRAATTANNGQWKITKKIFTDPGRNSLVVRATFESLDPAKSVQAFNVFVLNNPAINNAGDLDNSQTKTGGGREMLVASKPNSTASALAVSRPWKMTGGQPWISHGFVGRNDGWTDLFGGADDKTMDWHYDGAYNGNVAQMGWIDFGNNATKQISFDVVLSFGANEQEAVTVAGATLASDLDVMEQAYTQMWTTYTQGLNNQNGAADDQYYLAAMVLKSIQDKGNGAMVAGLGTPWGETSGDGNPGGYHLVWARDLFKFASALIAAGDTDSANKAVDYLFNVQMQTADKLDPLSQAVVAQKGRFPQNSWVNGTPYWPGVQMDESAMPIILAWKLNRTDLWDKVKMAADFVAAHGPRTDQDRWEEMAGYSPSTIAAEIAGLVCAADLGRKTNHPDDVARYLRTADGWRNNVANWTFTTAASQFHGNGRYYIRITANDDPNDDVILPFKNGVGAHGERYIIDGGFLELARMGVMSANDWTILETLPEYDGLLKQTLAGKGDAWFRYNYDGYVEHGDGRNFDGSGCGRLWPIFTAERGIYEIEKSGDGTSGQPYLTALKAFSSPAGLIPEQVWNESTIITGWPVLTPADRVPGTATGSMQPLSWAMGEYINLVTAIHRGRGDAPEIVRQRYSADRPQTTITFKVQATTNWGESIYLVGDDPLLGQWEPDAGIKMSPAEYPTWSVTLSLPALGNFSYKYARRDAQGVSRYEQGNDRGLTTPETGGQTISDSFR